VQAEPLPPFRRAGKAENRKETSSVLMIRLSRVGARKQPHYRVVVIEKERARNGRPVEIVGTYNPRTTPASVELKRERIDYWRSKGAQVSERVGKILGFAGERAGCAGGFVRH
jgi:small subunit ribosomal protein S16